MLRIMLPDSHCVVRFAYPDSVTGRLKMREGTIHNVGNGYFTCHIDGEGYKSFRFDRVRGPLESFVMRERSVTMYIPDNVTPGGVRV